MITTHVLDTAAGRPGKAIAIELERADASAWLPVGAGSTDDDGRLRTLTPSSPVTAGVYRIRFHTGAYLAAQLVAHAVVDLARQLAAHPDRLGEGAGVGGVRLERAQRELAELGRGVRGEQVRTAVHRVDRLARPRVARVAFGDARLLALDTPEGLLELLLGQRRSHHAAFCNIGADRGAPPRWHFNHGRARRD